MNKPWSDTFVARLKAGDLCVDEACGLVLVCSWPMPSTVQHAHDALRARLAATLPPEAYIYPASTLHCTVATLRAFHAGPLDAAKRRELVEAWTQVLATARAAPKWPAGPFRLRMGMPTFEGSAGIFRYDDIDGAIVAMRECLKTAITAAGGVAAEGVGDRSACRPPSSMPAGEPAPHLPTIVHSTVVRWAAEPQDRAAASTGFESAAKDWTPLEFTVEDGAVAVFESSPYMHMPISDAGVQQLIWWTSKEAKPGEMMQAAVAYGN